MKYIIERKQSGTGTIHDLASDQFDREISGRGKFAVVLAAFYGGRGYTTHQTEQAVIRQAAQIAKQGYSYQIIDERGQRYGIDESRLIREKI